MKPVRILIADSHEVVRRSVRTALEGQVAWSVCGEATTGPETVVLATHYSPDVVVLDVGLPDLDGIEVTRELRRLVPAVHVLALTMHMSGPLMQRLYDAGASGYMLKTDVGRTLVAAIEVLLERETLVTDQ